MEAWGDRGSGASGVVPDSWIVLDAPDVGSLSGIRELVTIVTISLGSPWGGDSESAPSPDGASNEATITVANDIVAAVALGTSGEPIHLWGVLSRCTVELVSFADSEEPLLVVHEQVILQPFEVLGTAEEAALAAEDAAFRLIQAAPNDGCWGKCMSAAQARHMESLKTCLTALGILVGSAAIACIVGCGFTGPGYLTCVLACFGGVGAGAVGGAGACVAA
ncbi:MAG TPA: hypothetical protein PKC43_10515 [Phycisphaerales bacterium]|nr:hypothetical protein [Phycisphaerales bacterium]HMP37868.1 hypothetical protein [Phycisphaerales bacterium]